MDTEPFLQIDKTYIAIGWKEGQGSLWAYRGLTERGHEFQCCEFGHDAAVKTFPFNTSDTFFKTRFLPHVTDDRQHEGAR